jgi:hypothetical protein
MATKVCPAAMKGHNCRRLGLVVFTGIAAATHIYAAESTMVPWPTRSADNARSGWNPHETLLTQASVASKGIIRATIIPVFGDARGMEAQPLILPSVKLRDGTLHDVMILPSMANVVRAVDAHTGAGLWSVTLGMPITGNISIGLRKSRPDGCAGDFPTIDCHAINDKWGLGLARRHATESAASCLRVECGRRNSSHAAGSGHRHECGAVIRELHAQTA